MAPDLSTAIVTSSGLVCVGRLLAFGRLTLISFKATGTVMMKMIKSTNMTSTSGVTLMSDSTSPSSPPLAVIAMATLLAGGCGGGLDGRRRSLLHPQSHLGARDQIGMQLMSEVADGFLQILVATQ